MIGERIRTERLVLRTWRRNDLGPFHALCNDPEVMRYLGPPLSRLKASDTIKRQQAIEAEVGYCFWPVERMEDGRFLGFCGVKPGAERTPIQGVVEIGWRFARDTWGHGYAREAAEAVLDWCWANLDTKEVVAITTPDNERSRGLMERLGMARNLADDFDHPNFIEGDPLRRHVLYRIGRP